MMPYMDTGFVGVSPGQLASYQSNSAYNEMNLERRLKDNEEQRARAYAAQQQQAELEGKRTLAADQYGYSAALADQEAGNRYGLANQNYMHEDELFERHAAAQMSQLRLEQIQQEKMAAIQREAQMERDYLQQDFNKQNIAQSQEFIAGQAEKRFQQEKEIGGIQHQYGLESAGLQHQYGLEDIGVQHRNLLETNTKLAEQHVLEEAFHVPIEAQKEKLLKAIEYGYRANAFKEENMLKARQMLVETGKAGIAAGTHVFNSPDDKRMLGELSRELSAITASPGVSREVKEQARLDINEKKNDIWMNARPLEPQELAESEAAIIENYAKLRGLNEDETAALGMGKNGPEPKRDILNYRLGVKKAEAAQKVLEQKEAEKKTKTQLDLNKTIATISTNLNKSRVSAYNSLVKQWKDTGLNFDKVPTPKEEAELKRKAIEAYPEPPELIQLRRYRAELNGEDWQQQEQQQQQIQQGQQQLREQAQYEFGRQVYDMFGGVMGGIPPSQQNQPQGQPTQPRQGGRILSAKGKFYWNGQKWVPTGS
jgi:hypothetical protein